MNYGDGHNKSNSPDDSWKENSKYIHMPTEMRFLQQKEKPDIVV